jgi:hypothetical protein
VPLDFAPTKEDPIYKNTREGVVAQIIYPILDSADYPIPGGENWPGLTAEGSAPTSRSVDVSSKKKNHWVSTHLYANPGEVFAVKIDGDNASEVGPKWQI